MDARSTAAHNTISEEMNCESGKCEKRGNKRFYAARFHVPWSQTGPHLSSRRRRSPLRARRRRTPRENRVHQTAPSESLACAIWKTRAVARPSCWCTASPSTTRQRWMDWSVAVVSGHDYLMKARQKLELLRMYFPLVAAQLI